MEFSLTSSCLCCKASFKTNEQDHAHREAVETSL